MERNKMANKTSNKTISDTGYVQCALSPEDPCPFCKSGDVVKAGMSYYGGKRQRWLCKKCGRTFTGEKGVGGGAVGASEFHCIAHAHGTALKPHGTTCPQPGKVNPRASPSPDGRRPWEGRRSILTKRAQQRVRKVLSGVGSLVFPFPSSLQKGERGLRGEGFEASRRTSVASEEGAESLHKSATPSPSKTRPTSGASEPLNPSERSEGVPGVDALIHALGFASGLLFAGVFIFANGHFERNQISAVMVDGQNTW